VLQSAFEFKFDLFEWLKMTSYSNGLVESVAVARQFEDNKLESLLNETYRSTRYRDAFLVELEDGEAWVFLYGVIIFWGADLALKSRLIADLENVAEDKFLQSEVERFNFTVGDVAQMREETLTLSENTPIERLAASHALAQSAKLGHFENRARDVIVQNEFIPRQLATSGRTSLSRKKLAKLRGTLFSVNSDILLNFNLLDTPEFFWSYPEQEAMYHTVAKYLDISPRITVLNKKLEAIHELLAMLAEEQNHKHSSLLEWIIILLIALELALFFVH